MSTTEGASKAHWQLPASLSALLTADAATVDALVPAPSAPRSGSVARPVDAAARAKSQPQVPFLTALNTLADARTTNGAFAHASTGSALVDLFDGLSSDFTGHKAWPLLSKAWEEDKEAIIFHARSIHEGKGSKTAFFRCVAWLWNNHPRTLLANLDMIVKPTCERKRSKKHDAARASKTEVLDDEGNIEVEEKEYPARPHGSFDDLNDILVLAVNAQLSTKYNGQLDAIDQALAPAALRNGFQTERLQRTGSKSHRRIGRVVTDWACRTPKNEGLSDVVRDFRHRLARCSTKKSRNQLISDRAAEMLARPKFQALYIPVLDIYERYIREDLCSLAKHNDYLKLPDEVRKAEGYGHPDSSPHIFSMSYAAKWAPTPGKSVDKQLLLATALALRLFPNDDTKTARQRLQKEVLTPLRRVLSVPEVNMVHGLWKIDYPKVPSLAMNRYQDHFVAHDRKRFEKYIMNVAKGKASMSGASMMPHALVAKCVNRQPGRTVVANLQWDSLVDSIRSSSENELSNCIAIADVSGSMGYLDDNHLKHPFQNPPPILPCIALTLLLTELSRAPWNGSFITFSESPEIVNIDSTLPLAKRVQSLSDASFGYNTDYNKVFKAILTAAKTNHLAPEDMVQKLFVFSDMQFDQSCTEAFGATEHDIVKGMFEEAGYELPEIVYWNLAGHPAKPVKADTPGTALVSGFNGSLLKYFIRSLSGEEGGEEEEETEGETKEEDEEMKEEDEQDEDGWEKLDEDLKAEGESTKRASGEEEQANTKRKKQKTKRNPLDHVMAAIKVKAFDGLRVVD